jgi:hypothetical protein
MFKMTIKKSDKPEKDYMAIFTPLGEGRSRKTYFGDASLDHYTSGATKKQRDAYLARHKKDLNTNDPKRAGFLSFYLLWSGFDEKPSRSLRKNIARYKKKFGFS